jgi:hypothetical protein
VKPADAAPKVNAEPAAPRRTLAELLAGGYVLATREDGAFTHVLTHGGVKLKFPGDEEKAGGLTDLQLTGRGPGPGTRSRVHRAFAHKAPPADPATPGWTDSPARNRIAR